MQDDDLIDAFEAGQIDGRDFPHERHVRVAWGLAQRYERADALRRLITGILAIAARAGRPEAYHHTITRAWFELISGAEDLCAFPELFDKTLLNRYYSSGRIAAGRERWLEPDLHPLELRAPSPRATRQNLPAVMRRIPTAVAILATRFDDTPHATTVSWFASVSRSPALISVCVANGSATLDAVRRANAFALSVLADDQDELAVRFAASDRAAGAAQFAGVPHESSAYGPVIKDATAWVGCWLHATHPCGDHHIVLGEVGLAQTPSDKHPLLRHDEQT